MIREEAIRLLSGLMFKGKLKEALDMAIKALEQEPCKCNADDCIDRDYTARYVEEFANNEYVSEHEAETIYLIAEGVRHIPAVYPKSDKPSGKWINNTHTSGCGITFLDYECNVCHKHTDECYDFCPNCGAKMESE